MIEDTDDPSNKLLIGIIKYIFCMFEVIYVELREFRVRGRYCHDKHFT